MPSNNTNSIYFNSASSGRQSLLTTQTVLSVASESKKVKKRTGRGLRGKALRNNECNTIGYLHSCPPRTIKQVDKLKYHRRISRVLVDNNFAESNSWKPNDLHCIAFDTTVTSKEQISLHFKSTKHEIKIWNCTPKYCSPCGIYYGFSTEQLWEAHIRSRRHKSTLSKLPIFKQKISEYGFTN